MGMAAYEINTGETHPLVGGIVTPSKRGTGTGSDTLTSYHSALWYGTISIGTPAVSFTGVSLFSPV